jgi:prephenate dehydratase
LPVTSDLLTAYQGAPGAFSEQAAWAIAGTDARLLPCDTLPEVFDAVSDGRATRAVVPFENTLAGTVPQTYELLLEHGLTVTAEASIRIEHMLIGHPSARLTDLRRVLSHPVALDQCRTFVRTHGLEPVPVFDTAGAVGLVMRQADRSLAAIASRRAARLHGAAILVEGIEDHRENWTRFLCLEPSTALAVTGRKAIVVFELRHERGSLGRALQHLAALGLNLTKIESRPIPGRPFEYAFLAEMTCQAPRPDWPAWLASLKRITSTVRLIATF